MAAPQIVNLAAKLFALDPLLTPSEAIDLIKRGASASEDGRRHLIDPKHTVNLLAGRTRSRRDSNGRQRRLRERSGIVKLFAPSAAGDE
jgi:hypothetical protein